MTDTTSKEWEAVEKRKPREQRCSYCGDTGHTVRECPTLAKRGA